MNLDIPYGVPEEQDKVKAWLELLYLSVQDWAQLPFGTEDGQLLTYNPSTTRRIEWRNAPDPWRSNNFGIRELNPFSDSTEVLNDEAREVSDRAGFLWWRIDGGDDFAIVFLTQTAVTIIDGTGVSTTSGNSGTTNVYFNGTDRWIVENKTGSDQVYFFCITSMGPQI